MGSNYTWPRLHLWHLVSGVKRLSYSWGQEGFSITAPEHLLRGDRDEGMMYSLHLASPGKKLYIIPSSLSPRAAR